MPGLSANDQRASEALDAAYRPKTAEWTDLGDGVWMVGPETATEIFFHDADPADARWATDRLRPQAYRVIEEKTPLVAWPDVPCRSIVCRDDHAIDPDWVPDRRARSAGHRGGRDRRRPLAVPDPSRTKLAGVLDAMAIDMDPKGR